MADETYRTIIEQIAHTKSSIVTVFADFCRISACALSAGAREEEYFEVIKSYSKDELELFSKAFALLIQETESKPFTDVLGTYYLEIAAHSSKQARGEFYTPPEICEVMAKMTVDAHSVISRGKPITVSEPSCGAGNMVLALAKQFSPIIQEGKKSYVDLLRVTCQDLNPVAVDSCFINTTLYGIPAKMIWGDTLRMTVNNSWKNIHWFRVGEDIRQAIKNSERMMTEHSKEELSDPQTENPPISTPSFLGTENQFEFDLGLEKPKKLSR